MRLINTLLKCNLLKILGMFCLLSLFGLLIYTLSDRSERMNSKLPDRIAIREVQAKSEKVETGGNPSIQRSVGIFTAYTSRPRETSRHPFITADKTNLKQHQTCVVANNRLKLGTKIQIQGIGTCEIRDRIGRSRGVNHFDIYMGNDVQGAKRFGTRKLLYSVIEEPKKAG